jgi:pimeloyl-ACP methyl ester carboxylesterase
MPGRTTTEGRKDMSLTVQQVQVYLEDRGSGEPVLFLHGIPDSADLWSGVIARLQGQYRCLAPDLPGLGRSLAPRRFSCSLEHMADFIDALLAALHLSLPLTLVVTDFGALYGLAWALTHPARVKRIAIVGGVSFFPDYRWHPDARLLRTPIVGDLAMASMTRSSFVRRMVASAPGLGAEHFTEIYDRWLQQASVRRMMLRLYRSIDFKDFAPWQDRLLTLTSKVPTLVLWGDRDPFIAPQYAERFGAGRVEHFPEYGHWLAGEAPSEVARHLQEFFTAEVGVLEKKGPPDLAIRTCTGYNRDRGRQSV